MKKQNTKQRRGRPSTFNRQETLTRAMNCYWKEGVYEISLNELCKRIEISKPTLYREYNNEDGLLHAVLQHYQHHILAPIDQVVSQHSSLTDKINSLLTLITTPREGPSGCLFIQLTLIPERLGPNTLALVQKLQQSMLQIYHSWILDAQQHGKCKQEYDSYFLAQYVYAQITSLVTRMNLKESPSMLRSQGQLAFSVLYT